MPQTQAATARHLSKSHKATGKSRYSVAIPAPLAEQVESYAQSSKVSVSKAIVTLVKLGLEGREVRKREFFKRLRSNLANDDPKVEDQMVDEFRALILGH